MTNGSDRAYFTRRARESLVAARDADDSCARNIHRALASAYDNLIDGIDGKARAAASLPVL